MRCMNNADSYLMVLSSFYSFAGDDSRQMILPRICNVLETDVNTVKTCTL